MAKQFKKIKRLEKKPLLVSASDVANEEPAIEICNGVVCLLDALGMRQRGVSEVKGFFKTLAFIEKKLRLMFDDRSCQILEHDGVWKDLQPPMLTSFGDSVLISWDFKTIKSREMRAFLGLLLICDVVNQIPMIGLTNGLTDRSGVLFRGAIGVGEYCFRIGPSGRACLGPAVAAVAVHYERPQAGAIIIDPSLRAEFEWYLDFSLGRCLPAMGHALLWTDLPMKSTDGSKGLLFERHLCINPVESPILIVERSIAGASTIEPKDFGVGYIQGEAPLELSQRWMKSMVNDLRTRAREGDTSAIAKIDQTLLLFDEGLKAIQIASSELSMRDMIEKVGIPALHRLR